MLGISRVEVTAFPDGWDVSVRERQGQDDTEGWSEQLGGERPPETPWRPPQRRSLSRHSFSNSHWLCPAQP